ncbi:unnamed protein product [Symbiodinium pilosum]|uniref:Uncharacterized protein n=1 Tax=Symbiodinium pilosum TaxID=2952 RepID=A0A812XPE5_SYMPI|nr:unnamed protein product [Symbiodinium pilosum]
MRLTGKTGTPCSCWSFMLTQRELRLAASMRLFKRETPRPRGIHSLTRTKVQTGGKVSLAGIVNLHVRASEWF